MSKKIYSLDPKDLKAIEQSSSIRRELAKESFQLFFEIYFAHYITAPMAWFHKEIFDCIEERNTRFATIMAFRGSGKSTIINTAFPLWSILGKHQLKFIIIVAQTQGQAKLYMRNLKEEILNNELLKKDLGPFREDGDEFNSSSIVLLRSQARITVVSVDQSTRGMRHRNHRPELIIADDIEDLQSVKTREGRDKLFEWFTKELIPLGDMKKTRVFLVGNMLHRDSLLMRMKERIENGQKSGVFRKYPLLDEQGKCLWSERYSEEDIKELRETIGSEIAWRTEYLLEDAGAEGRVIYRDWISWVDTLPENNQDFYSQRLLTGVDLAISQNSQADFTAFVTGHIYGYAEKRKIYIVDVLEKRMTFPETIETLSVYDMAQKQTFSHPKHTYVIENIGYQEALLQYLKKYSHIEAQSFRPMNSKRERLALVSELIKRGVIQFLNTPKVHSLVEQMIGFEKELHDDMVDAFTMMVLSVMDSQEVRALVPQMHRYSPGLPHRNIH